MYEAELRRQPTTSVRPSVLLNLNNCTLNRVVMCYRGGDGLIEPHGGTLKNAMVTDPAEKKKLLAECEGRKIECSHRNACDIELLSVGGFSPLDGFMNKVCISLPQHSLYNTMLTQHRAQPLTAVIKCTINALSIRITNYEGGTTREACTSLSVRYLDLVHTAPTSNCLCMFSSVHSSYPILSFSASFDTAVHLRTSLFLLLHH